MLFIYYTPLFQDKSNGEYPLTYFLICLVLLSVFSFIETTMFMSQLSFNAKISDEIIGGTYMTFLTTLGNLGTKIRPNIFKKNRFKKYFLMKKKNKVAHIHRHSRSIWSTFFRLNTVQMNRCSN